MNRSTIFILFSLIAWSTISFQIKNINHEINLQTSEQYIQYIKVLSGIINEEQLSKNLKLINIVQKQRLSVFNTVEDIVLVLVDQIKENPQNLPTIEDLESLYDLDQLLKNFNILNLGELNVQSVQQKIQDLQNSGKMVNKLQISEQLFNELSKNSKRRLQQVNKQASSDSSSDDSQQETTQKQTSDKSHQQKKVSDPLNLKTSSSYILKFFFGIVFIIICLASLSAIVNMENRKDTLLYAKFIADVGAR